MQTGDKRCKNGHYYDPSQYSMCPYCGVPSIDLTVTMAKRDLPNDGYTAKKPEMPNTDAADMNRTVPGRAVDSGKTIGRVRNQLGIDPVAGWLVCIEGNEKGKDYRLKSEKNFLGRGANMDVCIAGDAGISRENHATVSYDPKQNTFMLLPGDGHGLVYLNGNPIYTPVELQQGDCIELGNTKLKFVPFCGEDFQWLSE